VFDLLPDTILKCARCRQFRERSGVFYYEDTTTGKLLSLRTKDEAEARTLFIRVVNVRLVERKQRRSKRGRAGGDLVFSLCNAKPTSAGLV
jgi:hypothetical protein